MRWFVHEFDNLALKWLNMAGRSVGVEVAVEHETGPCCPVPCFALSARLWVKIGRASCRERV